MACYYNTIIAWCLRYLMQVMAMVPTTKMGIMAMMMMVIQIVNDDDDDYRVF